MITARVSPEPLNVNPDSDDGDYEGLEKDTVSNLTSWPELLCLYYSQSFSNCVNFL